MIHCEKKKFLIISPGRCASTSLRLALDEHPECLCHGEVFGLNSVHGISKKTPKLKLKPGHRKRKPKNTLNKLFPSKYQLEGAKFINFQMFEPSNLVYLRKILDDSNKVIILWREDLVSRLASYLSKRFGEGLISREQILSYDFEMVSMDCLQQIEMLKLTKAYLGTYPEIQILEVEFEDLTRHRGLETVHNFLGLDYKNKTLNMDARTKNNQNTPARDEWVLEHLNSIDGIDIFKNIPLSSF